MDRSGLVLKLRTDPTLHLRPLQHCSIAAFATFAALQHCSITAFAIFAAKRLQPKAIGLQPAIFLNHLQPQL
jgi:hypothetical protein